MLHVKPVVRRRRIRCSCILAALAVFPLNPHLQGFNLRDSATIRAAEGKAS